MRTEILDNIYVDIGEEPIFGYDQAYISYPTVFETVEFELVGTDGLISLVDALRRADGFGTYAEDEECWYDFYIGLNGFNDSKVDTCISAIVVNSWYDDDEQEYIIDIDDEEQRYIYDCIDEQCRKWLGKSADELMKEAKEEIA